MAENVEITGLSFNFDSNTDSAVDGIEKLSNAMGMLDVTKISQAQKSVSSLSKAINRLASADSGNINKASASIEGLSNSMNNLGGNVTSKINTVADSVKNLGNSFDGVDLTIDPDKVEVNEKSIEDKVEKGYEEAITKGTERAKQETEKMKFSFGDENVFDTTKFDFNQIDIGKHAGDVKETSSGYERLSEALSKVKGALPSIAPTIGKVGAGFLDATRKAEMFSISLAKIGAGKLAKGVSTLGTSLKSLGSSAKESAKNIALMGIEKLTSKFNIANGSVSKFISSLGRIMMYRAVRTLIKNFTASLSEGISNLYSWSNAVNGSFAPSMDRIATSTQYAKNALGAMVSPIINALAPAIDFLITKLVNAMNVINQFFSALTGHGFWTKAIKLPKKWGNTVASGAGKGSKAVKKLGKDAKKAFEPFLLDIDEINRLTKKSDASSGSGSGGGAGGGGIGTSAGQMFEKAPIDSAIKDFVDKIKKGKWEEAGQEIAKKLNTITKSLDDWINNKFRPKATHFASGLARLLNGAVEAYHWETLGKTFADGLNAMIDVGNTFLETFKFDKFGNAIGRGIDSAIKNVEWNNLGRLLGNYVNAVFSTVGEALKVFRKNGVEYGGKLADALNTMFDTVHWQDIGGTFADGINTVINIGMGFFNKGHFEKWGGDIFNAINDMIIGIEWNNLGKTFATGVTKVFTFFNSAISKFSSMSGTYGTLIGNAISDFFNNVNFDVIADTFSNAINGVVNTGLNAIEQVDWGSYSMKLFNSVDRFIKNTDWNSLAKLFGESISAVLSSINSAVIVFASNAPVYAKKLTDAINTLIHSIDFKTAGTAFVTGFNGIVKFLSDSVANMDWNYLKTNLVGSINDTIRGIDAKGFGEAINGLISNVLDLIGSVDWQSFGFKVGQFLGSIDWTKALTTVGKAIFDGLKGAVAGFFDSAGVESLWQAPAMALTLFGPGVFSKVVDFGKTASTVFQKLKTAFGGATAEGSGVTALMTKLGGFFTTNFPTVSTAIGGLGTKVTGALSGVMGAAGEFLSGPVGIAGLAVVAVGLIASNWGTISKAIGGLGKMAVDALGGAVRTISSGLGTLLGTLVKMAVEGWQKIAVAIVKEVNNFMRDPIGWGINIVGGLLKGIAQAVVAVPTWIYNNMIKPFVNSFCEALGIHSPSTVFEGFGKNIVEGLLNGIKSLVGNVGDAFNAIKDTAVDIFNGAKDTIGNIWDSASSTVKDIWKGMGEYANTHFGDIKNAVSNFFGEAKTKATNIWNDTKTFLGTKWSEIKSDASDKFNAVKTTVADAFNNAKTTSSNIWSNVKSSLSSTWSSIKSNASTVFNNVKNTIKNAWDNAKSNVSKAGESMVKSTNNNVPKIAEITKKAVSGMSSAISDKTSSIISKAGSIASGIKKKISPIATNGSKWGQDMVNGLADSLSGGIGRLSSIAQSIASSISSWLHFSRPDKGPLRYYDKWFPDMIDGLTGSLNKSAPTLYRAVNSMATKMANSLQGSIESQSGALEGAYSDYQALVDSSDKLYKKASSMPSMRLPDVSSSYNSLFTEDNKDVVDLLTRIYDVISGGANISVNIDGKEVFDAVVTENNRAKVRTGFSPLR